MALANAVADACVALSDHLSEESSFAQHGTSGEVLSNDTRTAPFAFIPLLAATFTADGFDQAAAQQHWSGTCFGSNVGTVESWTDDGVTIKIESSLRDKSRGKDCEGIYVLGGLSDYGDSGTVTALQSAWGSDRKDLQIDMAWSSASQERRSRLAGLRLFHYPTTLVETIQSLANTADVLLRSRGDWQVENVEWLQSVSPEVFGVATPRAEGDRDPIIMDADTIPDGTHLVVSRWDGNEVMSQWATGSLSGHHTIAFRDPTDGVLYVHESVDKPPGLAPYYPPPYGVRRATWEDWMGDAVSAGFGVGILPLRSDRPFDAAKAHAFFKENEGLPYGYHNYLHEWIDAGVKNLPWCANKGGCSDDDAMVIFESMEKWPCGNGTKIGVWTMILQAMNQRLGPEVAPLDSMEDFYDYVLDTENRTDLATRFVELVNAAEDDTWVYWNDPSVLESNRTEQMGRSMICEVFVYSTYKAAGVFDADSFDFNAAEIDPRSAYLLNIYNESFAWDDERCVKQMAETGYGFCQIMGNISNPLTGFNTIDPYEHMAETCEDLPPLYERLPENC